jgi:hypothetical protein
MFRYNMAAVSVSNVLWFINRGCPIELLPSTRDPFHRLDQQMP